MNQLETGKDKIKKICDQLRAETLDPAKEEAQAIIQKAEEKSRSIIHDAEERAKALIQKAHDQLVQERKVFETSLAAACKQGVEALRQDIESKLFSDELAAWVQKQTVDPKLQAELLSALISAVQKEGTSADFAGFIGTAVPKEALMAALGQQVLDKLQGKEVKVADFIGGVQLKLRDRRMILDISDEALKDLIGKYIRKDFRPLLFKEG
ncbi:MAG: V-type ATP synthase subunit E [Chlamydiales bacterium]|nr:V-type ATP synthase subunit E [Chlamydiales bacterium]